MRIGILGSYFNPPHIGHLLVAQQCLDFGGFDKLWFLPGFKSTFNKELLDVKHRLAMTRLLKLPKTEISTLELDHGLDGNTINLVPLLRKQYPQDTFTFIIGSDQLSTFHKWGQWERLLQELPFLVVPRAGFALEPIYPGMTVLQHPLLVQTNISSTVIRKRVADGLPIDGFVIPQVAQYIKAHKLYR